MVNGEFEFAWEEKGGNFIRQDEKNADKSENKVSLHEITKEELPKYHAGIDTIDGFCFSWNKKLTEEELDQIYLDYLVKEYDIEELDYCGNVKPINFELEWLDKASKIKKLTL